MFFSAGHKMNTDDDLLNQDVSGWIHRLRSPELPSSFETLGSPWRVSQSCDKADTVNKLLGI